MNFKKIPPRNFEWDEKKRFSNIKKHDIDFDDAKEAFNKPMLIKKDDRFNYREERHIAIGQMYELTIVLVFTLRNNNIRIISVRKANRKERDRYRKAVE